MVVNSALLVSIHGAFFLVRPALLGLLLTDFQFELVHRRTVTCLKKASLEGEHTELNVVQIQCEHLVEDSVHGYHLMLQSCKKSSAY